VSGVVADAVAGAMTAVVADAVADAVLVQ